MSRVTAYKCDACAQMIDGEVYKATLTRPTGKYACDLCETCSGDLFKMATFALKSRTKKPRAVAPARAAAA